MDSNNDPDGVWPYPFCFLSSPLPMDPSPPAPWKPSSPAQTTGQEPMLSCRTELEEEVSAFAPALSGAVAPPVEVLVELEQLCGGGVRERVSAARQLGRLGQRYAQVVKGLIAALADSEGLVRGAAAQALADLRVGEAAERIRPLLADPVSWTRTQAAEALAKLGDVSCVPTVLTCVRDVGAWVEQVCRTSRLEVLGVIAATLERAEPRTALEINAALRRVGIELARRAAAGTAKPSWHYRLLTDRRWQLVPTA